MLPECFLFTSFSCNTLHRIVVCKQELCRDIMNIGGLYHNFFQAAFIFCAFCYFLLLFLFDEIEIYTGDSSFFILHVIPHITTALCNLTGFCNWFWVTDHTVEIQGNPLITVTFKFIFQWFTQGFLFCTWYIFRKLTSFLWKIMILESTLSAVEKTISLLYLFILGNLPVYCHGRNAAWMIDSKV